MGAIAEQAVEFFLRNALMAGEVFTLAVLKKSIVARGLLHILHLVPDVSRHEWAQNGCRRADCPCFFILLSPLARKVGFVSLTGQVS